MGSMKHYLLYIYLKIVLYDFILSLKDGFFCSFLRFHYFTNPYSDFLRDLVLYLIYLLVQITVYFSSRFYW